MIKIFFCCENRLLKQGLAKMILTFDKKVNGVTLAIFPEGFNRLIDDITKAHRYFVAARGTCMANFNLAILRCVT